MSGFTADFGSRLSTRIAEFSGPPTSSVPGEVTWIRQSRTLRSSFPWNPIAPSPLLTCVSSPEPPHPEDRIPAAVFATTHWSLVLGAGGPDSPDARAALESLCRSYWPPIHAFIRRAGHSPESAQDLTQQFFARLLEKDWLHRADREQGRFRSFLLTYLKRFLSDERDRGGALKRGGGNPILSLEELRDDETSPYEPSEEITPDREFDRRWSLTTLDNALQCLRAEAERAGSGELFNALQDLLGGDGSGERQSQIGQRFGLGESAVKMRLNRWRIRYRELIRAEVARTVPRATDVDEELRHLMAALSD